MAFLLYIYFVLRYGKSILKTIPAVRLLLPLILGILLQYHFNISRFPFKVIGFIGLIFLIVYALLTTAKKFSWSWVSGFGFTIVLTAIGGLLTFEKNIEHQENWIGKQYQNNTPVLLTIQEPLVDKEKSYKALAKADALYIDGKWQSIVGDVLLYFKKDTTKPLLHYGSQIVFAKNLQPITNSGNPGGFDYARYCSFQNISYQAFVNDKSFFVLPTSDKNWFNELLINTRIKVLSILRNNIHDQNELSIAEALLIGYRDDLDRDLVQQYSNTGVVHIIAISGLHLGMIYGLLLLLFKPLGKFKITKIIKPLVILLVLWGFSFIAGSAPSIIRSAVMFTFIVIGESLGKRTNMYNSLAASAFVILLVNPFSLWDVGFQLSYSAVLSIVGFQKHINNWFYFKNKLLKGLWSLNAVTLSAQILTLPIVLYHFHQFPTLFLFTNIFAVPFSGFILYNALLLLVTYYIPYVGAFVGKIVGACVALMNYVIGGIDALPFSVWSALQISILQVIFLFIAIIGISKWLLQKSYRGIMIGFFGILFFMLLRSIDFLEKNNQAKMVVYNVSNHTAIDVIQGRDCKFLGDTVLKEDGFLRKFHINPSRILFRTNEADTLKNITFSNHIISNGNKHILIVDDTFEMPEIQQKIKLDAIVFTKNPKIYLNRFYQYFDCPMYVFDSSNPFWKIAYWQKDADSLNLRHHSTATKGAFVMNL